MRHGLSESIHAITQRYYFDWIEKVILGKMATFQMEFHRHGHTLYEAEETAIFSGQNDD